MSQLEQQSEPDQPRFFVHELLVTVAAPSKHIGAVRRQLEQIIKVGNENLDDDGKSFNVTALEIIHAPRYMRKEG